MCEIQPIAFIRSPFAEKFGVPRQGNLAPHVVSEIVFEPAFRNADCVRGLEQFSHLWLIWQFHRNGSVWHPTVRPPRLGGNTRLGVFATRSPFRPNGLGLSVVKLVSVEPGPVLRVSGADMVDGTPIFDIKPYVPYADAHPEAAGGFTDTAGDFLLDVTFPDTLLSILPAEKRQAALSVLSHDPRPSYQRKPGRIYGLTFAGYDIRFTVDDSTLTVVAVDPI